MDTKIVCRKSIRQDGTTKYKVRLTGRGFSQIPGKDYTDTYAPVAREESWRLVLAHGIQNQLTIRLYDIKSTYLNAAVEEEIFVQEPEFTGVRAWRLKKALYGLKQSAKVWNDLLQTLLAHTGFLPTPSDPALFRAHQQVCASMVDELLCALDPDQVEAFEKTLEKHVTLEKKGRLTLDQGMELCWNHEGVLVTRVRMIEELAKSHSVTYRASAPQPVILYEDSLAWPQKEY